MIKLTIDKGVWPEQPSFVQVIYHESCPNTKPGAAIKCDQVELFYPKTHQAPICPKCSAKLMGKKLTDSADQRVVYHLEAA